MHLGILFLLQGLIILGTPASNFQITIMNAILSYTIKDLNLTYSSDGTSNIKAFNERV